MSEQERIKLDTAIRYVERMSEGIHPVTNLPVQGGDVLNDPSVIRCMYFIQSILLQVRQYGIAPVTQKSGSKKKPFPLDVLSQFVYRENKSITQFLNQLKALANDPDVRGIRAKTITDWLKGMGLLEDEYDRPDGTKTTRTTPKGEAFGLSMEARVTMRGQEYEVIIYDRKAQEFIVDHMQEILNGEVIDMV